MSKRKIGNKIHKIDNNNNINKWKWYQQQKKKHNNVVNNNNMYLKLDNQEFIKMYRKKK